MTTITAMTGHPGGHVQSQRGDRRTLKSVLGGQFDVQQTSA